LLEPVEYNMIKKNNILCTMLQRCFIPKNQSMITRRGSLTGYVLGLLLNSYEFESPQAIESLYGC
jgi:hypothetical protein